MKLFTIGFTKKSAQTFFTRLKDAGVSRLIDVRLNNVSQLAGFAKRDDLCYFTNEICHIDYIHRTDLAPTAEILDPYKRDKSVRWDTYTAQFLDLMHSRRIDQTIPRELLDGACLLCSEDKPHKCHRRLIAEYLADRWGNVEITHL